MVKIKNYKSMEVGEQHPCHSKISRSTDLSFVRAWTRFLINGN